MFIYVFINIFVLVININISEIHWWFLYPSWLMGNAIIDAKLMM
jgi:hypothetical protein